MEVLEPNTQEEPGDDARPPSPDSYRDMNFISLKGYFGIDNPTVEEEDAMNWIYEQFEKMGPVNMAEILLSLREVERRISIPIDVGRLKAVRNFLKINSHIADLQGQLEAMK